MKTERELPNVTILNQPLSDDDIIALIAYHDGGDLDSVVKNKEGHAFYSHESDNEYTWKTLADFLKAQAKKNERRISHAYDRGMESNQELLRKALGMDDYLDDRLKYIEKSIERIENA